MLTHLAVFVACVLQDIVVVGWVNSVQAKRRWLAALFSVLCTYASQWATIFCVQDHSLINTTALGHGLGTILAVSWALRGDKAREK
jgi:hypothetical protein